MAGAGSKLAALGLETTDLGLAFSATSSIADGSAFFFFFAGFFALSLGVLAVDFFFRVAVPFLVVGGIL